MLAWYELGLAPEYFGREHLMIPRSRCLCLVLVGGLVASLAGIGVAPSLSAQQPSSAVVEITGVSINPKAPAVGTNYTVTDGANLFNVVPRVSTAAQSLVGDLIPTGTVNLYGVMSQLDATAPAPGVPGSGYQLLLLDDSSVRPVPEPSTMALAGLALAGLVAFARKRT